MHYFLVMKVIYATKGKAAEYAPLSVNLYHGCSHGCLYCFVPQATRTTAAAFHNTIAPVQDILPQLAEDCGKLFGDHREILLCFETDPYQKIEKELQITRQALKILKNYSLRFTILTKGGMRAARDFDLLQHYEKAAFGTTLIFTEQKDADRWEPGAASLENRIEAIRLAHKKKIRTWVSIEPVIDPKQCLEIIHNLHPVVNHWKIGKINYHPTIEKAVDWIQFRRDVTNLLRDLDTDFYLKKSLTEL